jgi:hypothetical protein
MSSRDFEGENPLYLPLYSQTLLQETAAQIHKIDSRFPWRQIVGFWPYLWLAAELLLPPLEPTDEVLIDAPPLLGCDPPL